MKKIIVIFLSLIFICACSSSKENSNLGYSTLNNQKHIIKEISFQEIQEKNKESYFLMIGRPSCTYCAQSILDYSKAAQENKLKEVYYYSFEEINIQAQKDGKLNKENEKIFKYFEDKFKFDGSTPVFYYIKNGERVYSSDEIDSSKMKSWFEILDNFYKKASLK